MSIREDEFRIVILGGTFNPVHNGHLELINYVNQNFESDLLVLLPSGMPPHKLITEKEHRVSMLFLARECTEANVIISDLETAREGYTFTYDSVVKIHEMFDNINEDSTLDEFVKKLAFSNKFLQNEQDLDNGQDFQNELDKKILDRIGKIKKSSKKLQIYYIIGYDVFLTIETWRNFEKLALLTNFIVVSREEARISTPAIKDNISVDVENKNKMQNLENNNNFLIEKTESDNNITNTSYITGFELITDVTDRITKRFKSQIIMLNGFHNSLSSSYIRKLFVNKNEDIITDDILCPNVKDYIVQNGLYRYEYNFDFFKKIIKEKLSEKRYLHSIGVAETARKLAKHYNQYEEIAGISGLLHDYAKEMPESELISIATQNGYPISPVDLECIDVLHGEVAYHLLKKEYPVLPESVLNSVRNHTLGRVNMSTMEKIIFIADIIEPNRPSFLVEKYHDLAYENLDKAILSYIDNNETYLKSCNKQIHPSCFVLRAWLKKEISGGKN